MLVTAYRYAFFKFMVNTVAERHGLRATSCLNRSPTLTGKGCYAHVSIWNMSACTNLFIDRNGEPGLSALVYHFLGGVPHQPKTYRQQLQTN